MSQYESLLKDQIFGRYQIIRLLGAGGMGEVYEALHLGLKKRFAIKTLLPAIAQSAEARARFLREGEAASRMNHPNVVDISDVGTEAGIPYLVMEYLDGETLGDFIARTGPLEISLAVDLILPAVSAVAAGHAQGVIHRDLKPQNIFLARGAWGETIPKILDFGVSKLVGGDNPALTGTMAILGTASYMAPEQARGARVVDAKSDQYAMGLIFFEMLTGRRAHEGKHPLEVLHKIASGVVLDARTLRPDLPAEVDAILARMLADQPAERHPSLRAVGRALLPFASERAQVMFSGVFVGDVQESTGAPVRSEMGRTLVLPPSGDSPKSGGTRLLPVSGLKEITTLGQSAVPTTPGLGGGSTAMFVIGGALLAAAIAGVIIFVGQGRSGGTADPAAATSAPISATRPAAGAELKPGADMAAPSPGLTPPSAPAPAPAPSRSRPADGVSRAPTAARPVHGSAKVQTEVSGPKTGTKSRLRRGANQAPIID